MFFKRREEQREETSQGKPETPSPLDKLRAQIEDARLPPHALEAVSKELENSLFDLGKAIMAGIEE